MMKNMLESVGQLIRCSYLIKHSSLDDGVKSKIKSAYYKAIFKQDINQCGRSVNVADYKVQFCHYKDFVHLFNEICVNNEYYFIADNDRPNIIDCGSNIGMSVLYFKMLYPKAKIKAFEPGIEAFECLKANVEENALEDVELHNIALSDKNGIVDFYCESGNAGSLRMSTKKNRVVKSEKRSVVVSVLSHYIVVEVDLLKIDVEGAEMEIMCELVSSHKLKHVKQIVIEYHHHLTNDHDNLSSMLSLLESAGFGYQIGGDLRRPLLKNQFQDIIIYAYQKNIKH